MSIVTRLKSFWHGAHPAIIVGGLVVVGHIGWKHIQDIGLGDKGRDYPHKRLIEICSNKIKEALSSEKNEGGKTDD